MYLTKRMEAEAKVLELTLQVQELKKKIQDHNDRMASVSMSKRPENVVVGLRVLADWFDGMYPDNPNTEVQEDLRRWAEELE